MSDVLALWLRIYELSPEEFAVLDDEDLTALAEALTPEETQELRRRLRGRRRRLPFRAM